VLLTCVEKLSPTSVEDRRILKLIPLLKKNIEKMRKIIEKFHNITQYSTKDYVEGEIIFDIDVASSGKPVK
jgi:hypothetical protein